MHRLLILSLGFLVLGTGCSKYSLVELYDGNWAGTATDAAGLAAPMTAAFTFNEGEEKFSGTLTYEGYIYTVTEAYSNEESGQIKLFFPELAWGLTLDQITMEEETSMKGNFTKALCYASPTNLDPLCNVTGTFTMAKQ